jgi:catechol 2,3-dioxygenase-like lactoylglutathione lyase family enzyme
VRCLDRGLRASLSTRKIARMIESGFVTLFATDLLRSQKFFIETLGMKLVQVDSAERAMIDVGSGLQLALCASRVTRPKTVSGSQDGHAPKPMSVGLRIRGDFDAAIAVYENRGIAFCIERGEHELVAHFADPDGNPFYFIKHV